MSSPRHVLITGASTGIGRTCALHLAARGWIVWAGVRRDADAESLRRGAPGAGGTLHPLILDVTDPATIAIAAERIRTDAGAPGLAGLVNNAGIGVTGPLELIATDDWRRQFEVNLFGQLAVTRAMLPLLRAHAAAAPGPRPARIVMISSIAGRVAQPMFGPYCASKFALEAASDTLRMELAAQRIGVSLIEPGAVKSEIWRKGMSDAARINLADPAAQRYEPLIAGVVALAGQAERLAIPALRAARAVERCLTARRPPARIRLGFDAKVTIVLKALVPTWAFDALMLSMIRLSARKAARGS